MKCLAFFTVFSLLCSIVTGALVIDEAVSKITQLINRTSQIETDLKSSDIFPEPESQSGNALQIQCENNGNSEAYESVKNSGIDLLNCIRGTVNTTVLQKEIEKAMPTGDLDEVFGKYCEKKSIVYGCVSKYAATMDPCLSQEEKENGKVINAVTDKILEFMCVKNGARIALFYHVKGPECIKSKAEAIKNCANSAYSSISAVLPAFNLLDGLDLFNSGIFELKDIPSFIFNRKSCEDLQKLQRCVVNALEDCEDPTSSNIFGAIFKYVKKVTPCVKF